MATIENIPKSKAWEKEIPNIARNHSQVSGTLAGFCFTVIAIVTMKTSSSSDNSLESMMLFLAAFVSYIASSVLYSIVCERTGRHRNFLFAAASYIYFTAAMDTLAGLIPLLISLNTTELCPTIFVVLFFSSLGGFLAASIPMRDLIVDKSTVGGLFMTALCAGGFLIINIVFMHYCYSNRIHITHAIKWVLFMVPLAVFFTSICTFYIFKFDYQLDEGGKNFFSYVPFFFATGAAFKATFILVLCAFLSC